MTKSATKGKTITIVHNRIDEEVEPFTYFENNPLTETRAHLQAVLRHVDRLRKFYHDAPAAFGEWIPSLVQLDQALHKAMKDLSKWEYSVKHEQLKKETMITLADTCDPFGEYLDPGEKE